MIYYFQIVAEDKLPPGSIFFHPDFSNPEHAEEEKFHCVRDDAVHHFYENGTYLRRVYFPCNISFQMEIVHSCLYRVNQIIIGDTYHLGDPKIYPFYQITYPRITQAINLKNFELIRIILQDNKNDLDYALQNAVNIGDLQVVEYIINEGAHIEAYHNSALKSAVRKGFLDIVTLLVKNGADIHADQDYVLHLACIQKKWDIVTYLLEQGANISGRNHGALKWCIMGDAPEIIRYLVEKGEQIDFDEHYALRIPILVRNLRLIIFVLKLYQEQNIKILPTTQVIFLHATMYQIFLEQAVHLQKEDTSVMYWAAEYGYPDIVLLMIKKGCVETLNHCLKLSIESGNVQTVSILISYGADIRLEGDYCLKKACELNKTELVTYLIKKLRGSVDFSVYRNIALKYRHNDLYRLLKQFKFPPTEFKVVSKIIS